MREHQGDRYESRIRDEEKGEYSIAEYIFETWSPTLSKHLLKYRDQSSCYNWTKLRVRIIEHIKSYRIFLIRRIK